MLFKNEKIKNRNRKYYCGRPKDFDESKASLSGRYLFPSQEFAFPYAMSGGVVEEYKMKDTADIFDIHCKTDEGRLRKYCQENCPEKLKYIEDFRNKQFAEISGESRYDDYKADRFQEDYFAKIIKELGYDGYFCIEADKNKEEAAKRFGRFYTCNKSNYSAIVIFNTDAVVKCNEYKMRDLADLDVEEYMVKNYAMEHLIENKHFSAAELIDGMKEQIFGLTDDEIKDVFNSITDEDLENEKIRQINVTKALLKRAGCSEERIKEIVEKKQLEMNNKETIMNENPIIEELKQKAATGDAEAQFQLGKKYANGDGVDQDYTKALKWYMKSAEQGNAKAQNNLGVMYKFGDGVEQDYVEAFKWFKKGAEGGSIKAQCNLGQMYSTGESGERSYIEAAKWFRKAAEQGEPFGQFALGCMYADGFGVEENVIEASEWFRKSAEQGNAQAQYNLAHYYFYGIGVEHNVAKAKELAQKAKELDPDLKDDDGILSNE